MNDKNNFKTTTKKGIGCFLSLVIVALGIWGAWYMIETAPVAKKAPPKKMNVRVEVQELKTSTATPKINAMGTVIPVHMVLLTSKVSGIVSKLGKKYGSGQIVNKGDPLIYIDDIDQKVAYQSALATVQQDKAALDIELGYQKIAKRELEVLKNENLAGDVSFKSEKDSALALRKPQLEIAKAKLAHAEAKLLQAKRNLEDCIVKAPFNGVIDANVTALGKYMSPSSPICNFYATDSFYVDATTPYENLKWLTIPVWSSSETKGNLVTVHINSINGLVGKRTAYICRMRPKLNVGDNMVRLMVKVEDPLDLKKEGNAPLLLDSRVEVEIEGNKIENCYKIPRNAWHENKEIWIATKDNKLHKFEPELIWRDKETVIISNKNLPEGTRIITTNLSMPYEGIDLDIVNDAQ